MCEPRESMPEKTFIPKVAKWFSIGAQMSWCCVAVEWGNTVSWFEVPRDCLPFFHENILYVGGSFQCCSLLLLPSTSKSQLLAALCLCIAQQPQCRRVRKCSTWIIIVTLDWEEDEVNMQGWKFRMWFRILHQISLLYKSCVARYAGWAAAGAALTALLQSPDAGVWLHTFLL